MGGDCVLLPLPYHSLPPPRPAMGGDCVLLPLPYHSLPWEEIVSFYLSPTMACLVCHRLKTSPVLSTSVLPYHSLPPPRPAMGGDCVLLPLPYHSLPWEETLSFYRLPYHSMPPPRPAMGPDCVSPLASPSTIACLVWEVT